MRPNQQALLSKLSGVRMESDGSAIGDCPVCGDKGKGKLKVFVDGTPSCRRYAGIGNGEHGKHIKEVYSATGFDEPVSTFINESLFDGRLSLELSPATRGRVLVVARNCKAILGRDEFNLDRMAERLKFVSSLASLTDDERNVVTATLIQLADRFTSAQKAVADEDAEDNIEQVSFKMLDDGRVIEQITSGFAVYDLVTKEARFCGEVEFDGVTYRPFSDSGPVRLADTLIEYGTDAQLDAEVEAYIYRNVDLPDRDRKLATRYTRFSYIADTLLETPYLRPIGQSGNGKSRYVQAIGSICYRPFIVVSPSPASIYRLLDRYHCTLAIDEGNFADGGDDVSEIIKILNSGFQKGNVIPRVESGRDGEFVVRTYDPFGPKLIASLKLFESQAFESRCIPAQMFETTRSNLQFRMSKRLLKEQAELRAKLLLWRLRNCTRDFEDLLDEAETQLRQYKIRARHVQIATPLYALIDDSGLKNEFAAMMEERTSADATERQDSFDGELIAAIHSLLFSLATDGTVTTASSLGVPSPEDGKVCELVPLESITEIINRDLPEKRKHDEKWIGRQIRKIGLRTGKINRRASDFYDKRALIINANVLARLFKIYSLPISADFNVGNVGSSVSVNDSNGLACRQENQDSADVEFNVGRVSDGKQTDLEDCRHCRQENSENGPEINIESASVSLVALDTETEPFDRKRGITPRNARMIGLALCYDGEAADYHTEPATWPLMLPEAEQRVVFHNAKFDLGVLEQAGLPLPPTWEDTLIAAHLLDENGEHGLKELAKGQLGIASPLTFAEADRMRLLDPQVFEEYARNDSRYTYRLWQQFEPRLNSEGLKPVYELEKSLVPIVREMERSGLKIDLSLIGTLQAEVSAECARIEQEIYDHAGCRFDLHSPAKVAAILYDKLGVKSQKQTNGGKRSVDKESLKDVRGYHPAVDAILRYREIDKLASTFIAVLPGFADEQGRIHPEFKALGAKTGRFSCSEPNVQQMPAKSALGKRLRQAFVADARNKLVVADYSQMELRVLAHYSRDPLLIEAYTSETETDLHTLTASWMFGRAIADVGKSERTVAKMINFGIAYGITPLGLFNRLRPEGHQVTLEDCEKFIADYFKAYVGVGRFLEKAETIIRQRGYVMNLYGRRRRLKGTTHREVRQAQNFIIQATAADLAKDAMVRLYEVLPAAAYLIAQVHDEFIVECREEDAEGVRDLMVQVMTTAPQGFTIPLKVDAHIVNNWGEAK